MLEWKVAFAKGKTRVKCTHATNKCKKALTRAAFFSFVFGAMLIPTGSFAAEASTAVEAPAVETGTVVVTGTRTEHLIEDVPQTMAVVTSQDIERMGAPSVKDVLNSIPGLQLEGQKGGINFRGMGFNNTVLLINGRRVATAENVKDAHNFYINSINVKNIERIEVIRGQAGALYGSNAIGGVVNIITKSSEKQSVTVGVEGGNEYVKNYWRLDTGKIGGFDAIFNASVSKLHDGLHEDKYYSTNYGSSVTPNGGWDKSYNGWDLAFNLDMGYAFNDDHEIRFVGDWAQQTYTDESKADGSSRVATSYADKLRYSGALVYNGTIDDHMLNMSATYSVMQIGKYQDPEWIQNLAGYQSANVDASERYYTDIFTTFTLAASDSWTITDWNTFTFGGEYSISTTNQVTAVHGNELSNWSVFAQNESVFFDDSLFILLQGRYDQYSADFGGAFTPNIGVTWEFIEDHRLKANWGMGFRAPTLAELYGTETTGNGTVYGSQELQPEKSNNFEVRYEGKVGPVSGSVGYFYSYIRDYITSVETFDYAQYPWLGANEASFLRENIGEVRNQGVEVELAYQINEYFKVKGSYLYNDARDISTNERVLYTSTDVVNLGLEFFHAEWGLSANLWGTYNDNFYSGNRKNGDPIVYDYYNMNFSATKTWGEEDQYKASFALYNFLQTQNDADNITSLNPLEVRVGFEMSF